MVRSKAQPPVRQRASAFLLHRRSRRCVAPDSPQQMNQGKAQWSYGKPSRSLNHPVTGCARRSQSRLSLATPPQKYGKQKRACSTPSCHAGTLGCPGRATRSTVRRNHASREKAAPQCTQMDTKKRCVIST